MSPFLVLAQPRSRTAWLSHFLTYGNWHCGHEEARHLRTLADAQAWLSMPFTGSAETAVAPHWRTLIKLRPDVKIVTVRRPVEESVASFIKLPGTKWDLDFLKRRIGSIDTKLDQIKARVADVVEVNFHDLTDEAVCARIFEHCLELPHDSARWQRLQAMNIQCDMRHISSYVQANYTAMQNMSGLAKQDTLNDFQRRAVFFEGPELAFREETDYAAWLEKAKPLIAEHAVAAGFRADHVDDFDHDLMRYDLEHGRLQIISCSSNGRMHGYLITTKGPMLAQKGKWVGEHTAFFASPLVPGVGRKLIKAANEALRHHGCDFIKYRAGINADGPRLAKLYERMGAQTIGEAFIQPL